MRSTNNVGIAGPHVRQTFLNIQEEGDDMNIFKYVKFKKVSNYVRPDVREEGDDMNILKYVKFKKV
jgi:hypothetical protein